MTMMKNIACGLRAVGLLAAVALFCGQPLYAQQGQQQQPGPAASGTAAQPPLYTPLQPVAGAENPNGDAGPRGNALLSGVQNLSAGLEIERSYWQPHIDVTSLADSNSLETANGLDWRTWTSVSGGLDLHQVRQNSNLDLGYTAGGMISNDRTVSNGIIQGLNFAEKYSMRHAAISLLDNFSYLPESAFGFEGLGATTIPATGQNGGALQFGPAQQILTGRNRTLSNADAVELDDYVSGRTALTFSGGYSLLHYFDSGLFNYRVLNARVGYNYRLTARDTFAVFYTYSDYQYDIAANSFDDHVVQVSYGRLISGKLAFQVAGGPLILVPRGTPAGGASRATSQWEWALDTNLQYTHRRYGMGLTYDHGVGGGAGAFIGAKTDTVAGTFTRQMSRTFTSGISGGYARTQGLDAAGNLTNQLFSYRYVGGNLTEPLSTSLALTASYQFQYQAANGSAGCVGPACGNVARHLISVGLGWHQRPLLF